MDFPADQPSDQIQQLPEKKQMIAALGLDSDMILNIEVSSQLRYAVIEVNPMVNIEELAIQSIALVKQFIVLLIIEPIVSGKRCTGYHHSCA
jgi:hypothetical protein